MKSQFLLLILCLGVSSLCWAKDIKHSEFNFQMSTHKLKATDLHYSFISVNKETFYKEAGPFMALMNKRSSDQSNDKFVMIRAVFPIKRAVGHFDHDKFKDLDFIKKIDNTSKVKKINENTFLTQKSTPVNHQYFSKFHFDSDDLSSLPDSRIGRKITELKSTDPLLLSANATLFREMFGFTQLIKESSEFYGLIALDETTTLVVFMKFAIYSPDGMDYAIERDLLKKIKTFKNVLEKR